MNLTPYSSVSAFIAHVRALQSDGQSGTSGNIAARPTLTADSFDEIKRVLDELSEDERLALGLTRASGETKPSDHFVSEGWPAAAGQPSDAASRRRARAELKLHRALVAHGLLAG